MSIALHLTRNPSKLAATLLLCTLFLGCGGAAVNEGPAWPPLAKKWYDRALSSFKAGDVQDADLSADNAIRLEPKRAEVRLLAAKIALAQLKFDRVVQLTDGLNDAESLSVRGRAFWYAGRVQEAAEALERLVADPEVKDPWAVDIAKLARRGVGRKPFTLSGGAVATSEMPRVGKAFLTPVEVDGEPALGMIATGVPETIIDASGNAGPKWISLRFGERIEVQDVPALTKDLSSVSRQLNAPVKIMLGVNLLRHLHATVDLLGAQFVVRTYEPPPPPVATTVALSYARGGGMMVRGGFGSGNAMIPGSFVIDTSMDVPLALDEAGWKKAGRSLADLKPIPGSKGMTQGVVPLFDLGSMEIPELPAIHGIPIQELERSAEVDLDGIIGGGLLAPFRVTFAEQGSVMWLEPMPVDPSMADGDPEGPQPEAPGADAAPRPASSSGPAPQPVAPSRPSSGNPNQPNPGLNAPLQR